MQFDESIRVVGERGCAAENERAFATQCRPDLGLCQDARDEAPCFFVPLAGRQRPGGCQQQPRASVEFFRRKLPKPFKHGAVPAAPHQGLVQAAFRETIGVLVLARSQRVTRCIVKKVLTGQPLRRTCMTPHLLRGIQAGKALSQHIAHQGVHPQPLTALGGSKYGSVAAQPRQPRTGVSGIGHHSRKGPRAGGRGWKYGPGNRDPWHPG